MSNVVPLFTALNRYFAMMIIHNLLSQQDQRFLHIFLYYTLKYFKNFSLCLVESDTVVAIEMRDIILFRDSFTVLFFAAFYNTAFFIIIWVERLF
jgi:hypothetical protein